MTRRYSPGWTGCARTVSTCSESRSSTPCAGSQPSPLVCFLIAIIYFNSGTRRAGRSVRLLTDGDNGVRSSVQAPSVRVPVDRFLETTLFEGVFLRGFRSVRGSAAHPVLVDFRSLVPTRRVILRSHDDDDAGRGSIQAVWKTGSRVSKENVQVLRILTSHLAPGTRYTIAHLSFDGGAKQFSNYDRVSLGSIVVKYNACLLVRMVNNCRVEM